MVIFKWVCGRNADFVADFIKITLKTLHHRYFVADFIKLIIISVPHDRRPMHRYFVADFIEIISMPQRYFGA